MGDPKVKRETRRDKAGRQMADALIEFIHMMYQKDTAKGVLLALINRLCSRSSEFYQAEGSGEGGGH
uniref:Uncharacterized protein n=1 Tax=viral metagenome TaxID=1070528 RepID=A0A6M3IUP0_9ZZZZ